MTKYLEPFIWTLALLVLFFTDTSKETFSFCVVKMIGFQSCPGCGIGHAIHDALHLDFKESLDDHILGIPATVVLLYHIVKTSILKYKLNEHGSTTNADDAAGTATGRTLVPAGRYE